MPKPKPAATVTRTALVLAGGGARGAYEAGALSVLLPELERCGQRPRILIGTSVGSFNTLSLAGDAHRSAAEACGRLIEKWTAVRRGDVFGPVVSRHSTAVAARFAAGMLSVAGFRTPALLDATPLRALLERWIDWPAVHANIARGDLDCVAVVASNAANPNSMVFVEGADRSALPAGHTTGYANCQLTVDHVLASAAIPVLFPAVHLDGPASSAGWYFDGSTRLATPLKPALDLGAERVVVVATYSIAPRPGELWQRDGRPPDMAAGAMQLLSSTMIDPMVEDVRRLGQTNLLIGDGAAASAAASYRQDQGPATVPPSALHVRGATQPWCAGRRRLDTSPELALISRLLGGESVQHGELISYILIDPAYIAQIIDLGAGDARRWLNRVHGAEAPWWTAPIDTLEDS